MTTVTLHGALGDAMGHSVWKLQISQPREAIAAIHANTKGKLYPWLDEHKEIEFCVLINGKYYGDLQEFYFVGAYETMDITPVPSGSGGIWGIILGALLIVVAIVLLYTPFAAVSPYLILGGIALIAGGVAQLISPSPKLGSAFGRQFHNDTLSKQADDSGGKKPSYLFQGAQNTIDQGGPVPICYGGPIIVGSQQISLGVYGASIAAQPIGVEKPPADHDSFYDLPVWARLAADSRAALIPDPDFVKRMSKADMIQLAPTFDIPNVFPADHKQNAGDRISAESKRAWLKWLALLFNGPQRGISFDQAVSLYNMLDLKTLPAPGSSSWEEVVEAVGLHYSPA